MIFGGKKRQKREPEIDFSRLPMQEVVLILRRLGLQTIDDLLTGNRRPDLGTRLTVRESHMLQNRRAWKISWWRRLVHVPEGFPGNLAIGMRDMLSSALLGIISKRQWQIRMRDRLALATDVAECDILPDWSWSPVSHTAWRDPGFCHEVAWRIFNYHRIRLPLSDGSVSPVILNPNTFWVLLALADVRPGKHWLRGKERSRARQADLLRRIARYQAFGGKWAGFWDQWLIRMACEKWPEGLQNLPRGFRLALSRMPLMRGLVPPKRRLTAARIFRGLSRKLFLSSKGSRRPASLKTIKDLDLTNPDWAGEIPSWMLARYASYTH